MIGWTADTVMALACLPQSLYMVRCVVLRAELPYWLVGAMAFQCGWQIRSRIAIHDDGLPM